jgi:hypothetical protein
VHLAYFSRLCLVIFSWAQILLGPFLVLDPIWHRCDSPIFSQLPSRIILNLTLILKFSTWARSKSCSWIVSFWQQCTLVETWTLY